MIDIVSITLLQTPFSFEESEPEVATELRVLPRRPRNIPLDERSRNVALLSRPRNIGLPDR